MKTINLKKMFEAQRELDKRIIKEKGLETRELWVEKQLALCTELGEMANEWRKFKYWSDDQETRREKLLEEYVDCLHFVLSIGLDLGFDQAKVKTDDNQSLRTVDMLLFFKTPVKDKYLKEFIELAFSFGFTWEEVEAAYFKKNAVNHDRQDVGY